MLYEEVGFAYYMNAAAEDSQALVGLVGSA